MNDRNLYSAKRKDNGKWVEGFYFCMIHDDGRHIHHFIMPLGTNLSTGMQDVGKGEKIWRSLEN